MTATTVASLSEQRALRFERDSMLVQQGERSRSAESHKLAELPILLLNVHDNCNCRCLMCDIWQRPPGKEIDLRDLARLRHSIATLRVREIVLTGGEPLLHSNFDDLCQSLKSCGVKLTLLTTGLLLQRRAQAVAKWVDEVIISLDGPESTHDEIRRVRHAFDLIRRGISAIRALSPVLPIRARSTVQRANFLCLRQTVAAARSLGFNSISFLAADVSSTAFNRELVWPLEQQNRIALTRSEIDALETEMNQLIAEYWQEIQEKYISESPEKLRRIIRHFREHLGDLAPESPICNAPWVSAVVEVDGSVRPCFFHRKVGNTALDTLEAAINSDEALKFRSTLNVAENPTCRRCVCSLNYRGTATAI